MLILDLVKQEWLKSIRAQGFYKNVAVSIFLGAFALYMMAILLFLGFSLPKILEEIKGGLSPTEMFNGAMLYLILGGLTLRFSCNNSTLSTYLPIRYCR